MKRHSGNEPLRTEKKRQEKRKEISWRTNGGTLRGWRQGTPKFHWLSANRTKRLLGRSCRRIGFPLGEGVLIGKQFFRKSERGAAIVSEETEVAHFDKALGQDMLQETLHELLDRKRTEFELSGIGLAVLKSNLRFLHAALVHQFNQAAIADGDTIDIRSQILERGLTIPDRQAMHDPVA